MSIRSLLVAVACTLPLASFIVAAPYAAAGERARSTEPTSLKCPPYCPKYGKGHDRFRKRLHDGQPDFDRPHWKEAHRFHKRSHSRRNVRLRFYPGYYDPFYRDPFYYDPFYHEPYYGWVDTPDYIDRLTCKQAIAVLRRHGYRNVKAFDCRGKSYGFYATRGGKKYKITVSSFDGDIISRKRITR